MTASMAGDEEDILKDTDNKTVDSKYRLIHRAARRAKQITNGAEPRVALKTEDHKATYIALEELKERKP
jgi:DNA-directed RNA polymerase omega subunit